MYKNRINVKAARCKGRANKIQVHGSNIEQYLVFKRYENNKIYLFYKKISPM